MKSYNAFFMITMAILLGADIVLCCKALGLGAIQSFFVLIFMSVLVWRFLIALVENRKEQEEKLNKTEDYWKEKLAENEGRRVDEHA